jgi:hypothetical protein
MRGRIVHVDELCYLAKVEGLALPVVVYKADIVPPGLTKNLDELLTNSNGDRWSIGLHLDFDIFDDGGLTVARGVSVCLPNTGA